MEIQGPSNSPGAGGWQGVLPVTATPAFAWSSIPASASTNPTAMHVAPQTLHSLLCSIAEIRRIDSIQGQSLRQGLQQLDQRMHKLRYASQTAAGLSGSRQQPGAGVPGYQLQRFREQLLLYAGEEFALKAGEQLGSAASATAIERGTATGSTGIGASSVLGAIGAAYNGFQMIDSWGASTPQAGATQGAAMGAYVGSVVPGVGTAIGAVIGGVLGAAAGSISSGKHADQKARDAVRGFLQERGMLDEQYQLELADGSVYDIGSDGGHRLHGLDGSERAAYQVDVSNPLSQHVVGWLDPLAEVLTGGNEKLRSDFSGYFCNAALSNASGIEEARANVLAIYQSAGLSIDTLARALGHLQQNGLIDSSRLSAYLNGLRTLVAAN